MRVVSLQAGNARYEQRSGSLVDPSGALADGSIGDLGWLLRIAVLCNEVVLDDDSGERVLEGSPTESALIRLALLLGLEPHAIRAAHPLLKTQRRAQTRNYMATLHASPEGRLLAVKGRPSEVLSLCTSYLSHGRQVALSGAQRAQFLADNERMAGQALRVLGLAFLDRELEGQGDPKGLTWLGLIGMEDPPREGLAGVISRFHEAGIRTVMITGDQTGTARAIGEKIGLAAGGPLEVVDATELRDIAPARLSSLAQRAHVFARVSPEHKLQIVRALSDAGSVVAMTGDGINDGPALRAADIGIAMGSSGTRTAQEMADLVLEEDQLEVLLTAVEQGRTLYADLRKAVHFLLATNLSEILYTFTCVASRTGGALTPRQLLWINLLTDVFPGLALSVQPPEPNVLSHPPRDSTRPMFEKRDLARVGREGAVITAGALAAYFSTLARSRSVERARSAGFTTLTFAQLAHALSVRSETRGALERDPTRRDPWFPLAMGGTALVQLAAGLIPGWRKFLQCEQLSGADWTRVLAAAGATLAVNEAAKYAQHRAPRVLRSV